ncbi:MAG: AbrB/MazE/SpoVT family DNA-binding domain-containing protein, partial [Candidatus Nanoarchaeia archaeon]
MKRKTIRLAGKTLVVSLPSKWVKQYGVQKGDELEVKGLGPTLHISAGESTVHSTTELNASTLSDRALRWALSSLHKKGYTEITVYYTKQKTLDTIRELLKELFIGFTIVDQRKSSCIIRALAREEAKEFDTSMRRAFLVTLSMGEQITESLRENNINDLRPIAELEKTNNQLTNFCQRIINMGLINPKKSTFQYVIAWNLEKVADEFKHICKRLKKAPSKESIQYVEDITNMLRSYYELLYKFEQNKLTEASLKTKELRMK